MPKLSRIEIIREIAKQTDLSTSSVYKILNNPFDFSRNTAKQVLQLADDYGYNGAVLSEDGAYRICVLIPSRPAYYWREAMAGMKSAQRDINRLSDKPVELMFNYLHLRLGDEMLRGVYTELLKCEADGFIIFPALLPECQQLISIKSKAHPVILFNEYRSEQFFKQFPNVEDLNHTNIASVSADNMDEGRAAFKLIEDRLDEIKHFVFINSRGDLRQTPLTSILRMESCRHELLQAKPDIKIDYINFEMTSKLTTSFLSRKLYDLQLLHPIDCVYITTGVTHVACAAIEKMKERFSEEPRIVCIGHEYSLSDRKYLDRGIQLGYIKQDVYRQGYDAVMMLRNNLSKGEPLKDKLYRSICCVK